MQESNRLESLTILRAFLHLVRQQKYPNEFIQYQLGILKDFSTSLPIPSVFELVKQLVPVSKCIFSFNSIRQLIVEYYINQFRKDTQKQKWVGDGEKIHLLKCLLERSLELDHSNENLIKTTKNIWNSMVVDLFEPLFNELSEYLKKTVDKRQQQYLSLSHLIKPLGELCEQTNKLDKKKVRDNFN